MMNIVGILILGVSYGLILFLLATGMTLTMGLMRIVNMSHGAIYMISGYLGVSVYAKTNSWMLAVLAALVLGGVLGLLLEIGFLRRLYDKPTNQVLLTIGFINIINNIAQWIWGGDPVSAPIPELFRTMRPVIFGTVGVPPFRFFIIGFGVLMAILLWVLQDKTRVGAMVRAGMDNREISGTLGINNKVVFTSVFVLGSLVAGLSSIVGGSVTGLGMGTSWSVLLNSIIVVVLGGTGSIQGALLGGVIIGIVNAFGTIYFNNLSSFLVYAILIVVLLLKPTGLLGRKMDVNKAADNSVNKIGLAKKKRGVWTAEELGLKKPGDLLKLKLYRAAPYIIALLLLTTVPLGVNTYMQSMLTRVLIFALFAMSLDVIMGYTGMRSFGHAAFFGLGGYTVGILTTHFNITSFWIVLPAVIIVSALVSALIGYFTLRTSGTYFLMVTMAFGQLLFVVADKAISITGGSDGLRGIPKPDLGWEIEWTSRKTYVFVLCIFLLCYIVLNRVMHSAFGRALVGVRENESRMRALGYNTWQLKYGGVIIAGVFAGIAGLLYAYMYNLMVPSLLALETSAQPMLMVIMGGGSTLWGPAIGAAVIILFQAFANINFEARWPLVLGLLYVLCVMFLRGGFSHYLVSVWDKVGGLLFGKKKETVKQTVKKD